MPEGRGLLGLSQGAVAGSIPVDADRVDGREPTDGVRGVRPEQGSEHGLTFRMSGPGQIVFYGFLVLFSPVVAQIYAMSSIARYFVDPGGPF